MLFYFSTLYWGPHIRAKTYVNKRGKVLEICTFIIFMKGHHSLDRGTVSTSMESAVRFSSNFKTSLIKADNFSWFNTMASHGLITAMFRLVKEWKAFLMSSLFRNVSLLEWLVSASIVLEISFCRKATIDFPETRARWLFWWDVSSNRKTRP